ncbi:hypothetical protein [Bacillus tuaregi]|uniref:hypothetical protein n=1 Tax=Bacillus tuaregi TaxID=1816695 RepID=UPI0008F95EF6|nr:hypothetical protein [Bacillus tuaregi]
MRFFLKLNVVSILYALMIFIPIELVFNVYRISRLTSWKIDNVIIVTGITNIVVFIFCTILLIRLTKRWLEGRKANFWTIILWFPYFILLIYIFASLFPLTNGGDYPNPVTGLLAIGGLIVFPIYILIINFVGFGSDDRTIEVT